nr:hypothetical protein [Mycoplasmopsis bovis]
MRYGRWSRYSQLNQDKVQIAKAGQSPAGKSGQGTDAKKQDLTQ